MSPRRPHPAFTLIELLVAMVVLSLLITVSVGFINSIGQLATTDRLHQEADGEARRVFDRMGLDFARMLKRPDTDATFNSVATVDSTHLGNDNFFFYSEAPAFYDTSALTSPYPVQSSPSLIGYRVNSTSLQLERLGKGLNWDGTWTATTPGSAIFLTYPVATVSPSPTPNINSQIINIWGTTASGPSTTPPLGTSTNHYNDGVDADYHVLSASVFRLEYCFVMKGAPAATQFSLTRSPTGGFSDVSAVVVAIALLDPTNRSLISGQMGALAAALPDPNFTTSPYTLMAPLWNGTMQNPSSVNYPAFAALQLPARVTAQIRVYQRYFYLNTPP